MREFSLHDLPVARQFLAGGPDRLRLSLPAAAVVICGGVLLLGVGTVASLIGVPVGPAVWWPATAPATLLALLIAALAARWLGGRLGALAGLVQLTTLHALMPARRDMADMLFCAVVTAAMGAFALANVPGRLPLVDGRWTRWAFYAAAGLAMVLAGPLGPGLIFAGCLLFLALCADSRGLRFFADRVGIALFVLLASVRLAYLAGWPNLFRPPAGLGGDTLSTPMSLPDAWSWPAVAALPWTPLVALRVAAGLRQGHYATPFWRFCGCWLLGPLVAMTIVGAFRREPFLGALMPPLAVIGAAGLSGLIVWSGRTWPKLWGRRAGGR